ASGETTSPLLANNFTTPVTYSDMLFGEWNVDKTTHFMTHTNQPIAIGILISYLLMIQFGPKIMESRKAFDLQRALAMWNMALFAYSALSLYLLIPEVVQTYNKGGVIRILCYKDEAYTHSLYAWLYWMYVMSKGPELIDTVFLVLRKRPVIFMHWYHHSVTFILPALLYTQYLPWVRLGVVFNLYVHTIMYFYYGLRAMGIKTPRWVSKGITLTQITQFASMFFFLGVLIHKYVTDGPDEMRGCMANFDIMALGIFVVSSYLYLFCDYFYKTYVKNEQPTRLKKIDNSETEREKEKAL
ncbi:hypothetical protein PMAYCL1PPCAC_15067, partial [Pristionchus mayeri]